MYRSKEGRSLVLHPHSREKKEGRKEGRNAKEGRKECEGRNANKERMNGGFNGEL
jgi:hypothetical protein